MKKVNKKIKKAFIVSICVILLVVAGVILFISPITKYLIEKYDRKYTGREIKMKWAYVNPFTGYVYLSNLKIYESKSDSVFFSANSISLSFSMLKLFSNTYEISQLILDHPRGIIIQGHEKELNFDDLIKKFTPEATDTIISRGHFNILDIHIKNGEFHYREDVIPINYFIKDVNFESTGKRWNADTIAGIFSFVPGIGKGNLKGNFTIDFKKLNYRYDVIIQQLDLKIIEQYLNELINYGSFSANLDADMKATGSLTDEEDVTAIGMLAINDFKIGTNPENDYASFDRLVMDINELSPKKHKYFFDSVALIHPYFKYELYDQIDNLETMFGKKGANIYEVKDNPARFNLIVELARYVKVLARNFFSSYYKIDKLALYDGDFRLNDYSISEKFTVGLNQLSVMADSIDKHHRHVDMFFKTAVHPYGNARVDLSINPNDSGDFNMDYHFQKLPVSMFNPYTISYTSFPLDRGTIEFNGIWNVRKGNIQSENHLLIVDPRVTKRLRNKDTKWMPLPLIMSFIRERGNVIDYEIPITGNLKNPKFHLHDVLFDLLGNIFIKPATTPYRTQVKNIETEIEKALTLKWEMRKHSLLPSQEKFVGRMADFLVKNPEASIAVSPIVYEAKEKEYILLFEARKKYYLSSRGKDDQLLTEQDSAKIDKMSARDSLFFKYINNLASDRFLFSIQEKCENVIGSSLVDARLKQLNKERETAFISFFKDKGVGGRVKISSIENTIPYNGFSFYKIGYQGDIPKELRKAYRQMNELNEEAPRNGFIKERKKNSIVNKE